MTGPRRAALPAFGTGSDGKAQQFDGSDEDTSQGWRRAETEVRIRTRRDRASTPSVSLLRIKELRRQLQDVVTAGGGTCPRS